MSSFVTTSALWSPHTIPISRTIPIFGRRWLRYARKSSTFASMLHNLLTIFSVARFPVLTINNHVPPNHSLVPTHVAHELAKLYLFSPLSCLFFCLCMLLVFVHPFGWILVLAATLHVCMVHLSVFLFFQIKFAFHFSNSWPVFCKTNRLMCRSGGIFVLRTALVWNIIPFLCSQYPVCWARLEYLGIYITAYLIICHKITITVALLNGYVISYYFLKNQNSRTFTRANVYYLFPFGGFSPLYLPFTDKRTSLSSKFSLLSVTVLLRRMIPRQYYWIQWFLYDRIDKFIRTPGVLNKRFITASVGLWSVSILQWRQCAQHNASS